MRESSIKKTLVETEATAEGGDLTIHFLTRHMVSRISWQHSQNGCGSSTVLKQSQSSLRGRRRRRFPSVVESQGLGSWTGWGPCHVIVVGGKVMRWRQYHQEGWRVDGLRQEDQVEWWRGSEGGWWHCIMGVKEAVGTGSQVVAGEI